MSARRSQEMFPHSLRASNSGDSYSNVNGFPAGTQTSSSSMLHQLQQAFGPQIVHDIVRQVRDDTAARVAVIRRSLAAADFAAAKRDAHLIKSSAAILGADSMSALCKRIELSADA